jgi:hypothetical protein
MMMKNEDELSWTVKIRPQFNEICRRNHYTIALPSGTGKTTLAQAFPDLFYDVDELYEPFMGEIINLVSQRKWTELKALQVSIVSTFSWDRVLLVHDAYHGACIFSGKVSLGLMSLHKRKVPLHNWRNSDFQIYPSHDRLLHSMFFAMQDYGLLETFSGPPIIRPSLQTDSVQCEDKNDGRISTKMCHHVAKIFLKWAFDNGKLRILNRFFSHNYGYDRPYHYGCCNYYGSVFRIGYRIAFCDLDKTFMFFESGGLGKEIAYIARHGEDMYIVTEWISGQPSYDLRFSITATKDNLEYLCSMKHVDEKWYDGEYEMIRWEPVVGIKHENCFSCIDIGLDESINYFDVIGTKVIRVVERLEGEHFVRVSSKVVYSNEDDLIEVTELPDEWLNFR